MVRGITTISSGRRLFVLAGAWQQQQHSLWILSDALCGEHNQQHGIQSQTDGEEWSGVSPRYQIQGNKYMVTNTRLH